LLIKRTKTVIEQSDGSEGVGGIRGEGKDFVNRGNVNIFINSGEKLWM